MAGAEFAEAPVDLHRSGDEALVLFEWLGRFNASDSTFEDQAEQRVLWDLEASLEKHLVSPSREDYPAQLAAARARARDAVE